MTSNTSLWDMSTTAASNTSVQSINIGEGTAPSNINDGMRAMIAQALGALKTVTAGGTADALTATLAPAPDALTNGMMARVRAASANATTTPTFAPNGLTAHTITKNGNLALAAGDIVGAGHELILCYNSSNTAWELLNPKAAVAFTGGTLTVTTLMSGAAFNEAQGGDIASATTTDIGAATGNYVKVTGTTTITGLGTVQAGTRRIVEFTGILTLTHNASSLILPGGASITTAAGDVAMFISEGSGNWRCAFYTQPATALYSEGTWTPVIAGTSTAGSQTYTSQIGRYIRVGNLVTIWCSVQTSAIGGTIAGNVSITGLPFTATNVANFFQSLTAIGGGVTFSGGGVSLAPFINPNTAIISFDQQGTGIGLNVLPVSSLAASTLLIVSGSYRIN